MRGNGRGRGKGKRGTMERAGKENGRHDDLNENNVHKVYYSREGAGDKIFKELLDWGVLFISS